MAAFIVATTVLSLYHVWHYPLDDENDVNDDGNYKNANVDYDDSQFLFRSYFRTKWYPWIQIVNTFQFEFVDKVQAESGARIHFKDEVATDTERILMVRGNQESAQKAEMMIKQIIHDIPEVHTIDLFVPQRFLGRLIGKNGDNIRNLQRWTGWGWGE